MNKDNKPMKLLLKKLSDLQGQLYKIGPQDPKVVHQAEETLEVSFGEELREYLSTLGAISYKGIELTGLGVKDNSHLNIVYRTKLVRDQWAIPKEFVVIEDLGDGLFELCNMNDKVYFVAEGGEIKDDQMSLQEYIIQRLLNEDDNSTNKVST